MIIRVCHHCEKPFLEGERQRYIPVERPYMNLILHAECWELVNADLIQYLSTNLERCYNLWRIGGKKEK